MPLTTSPGGLTVTTQPGPLAPCPPQGVLEATAQPLHEVSLQGVF